MQKKNRRNLFNFLIMVLLSLCLILVDQGAKATEKVPAEESVLTLKYGIDIDVFFGPGEGEIGYAPKSFYVRDNILAIDNHGKHEIRVFDIKQKKLIRLFSIPPGEIENIVIGPDNTIYYLTNKWSGHGEFLGRMISKISQERESLFIPKASLLPDEMKEKIYKKSPYTHRPEINWEELFIDRHNNLYVRVLTSILQYNSKGEIVRVVPGFPSETFMPAPKRQAQKGMKIPPTYILPLRGGRKQEGVKKGDFQGENRFYKRNYQTRP